MEVQLFQPFGYSEIGGRTNNEDFIFPNPASVNIENRLFVVCDGVGGAEKGEIASELACRSFAKFFKDNDIENSDENTIADALNFVEESFDSYFTENPASKGMATTATLLYIHTKGATIAHIGDSRVYLVRDGNIIFQTKDHSFAMELFEGGFITLEEARKHPRKNEITRAIQGKKVRSTQADVTLIEDLKAGDVFILCTDGVLERVDENLLEDIVREYNDPSMIGQALINISMGQTRDNFSAYIIKVRGVSINTEGSDHPETISNDKDLSQGTAIAESMIDQEHGSSHKKNRIWLLMVLIIAVISFAGFIIYDKKPYDLFKRTEAQQPEFIKTETKAKPVLQKKSDIVTKADSIHKKEEVASQNIDSNEKLHDYTDVHKWNGFLTLIKNREAYGLRSTATNSIRLKPEFDIISDKGDNMGEYHWVIKDGKFGFIYLGKNGIKFLNARCDTVLSLKQKDGKALVRKDNKELTIDLRKEFENRANKTIIRGY